MAADTDGDGVPDRNLGTVYAFVATVLVHPSLLALWARYGGQAPQSSPQGVAADD